MDPLKDKVIPLIDSAAKDYATANSGWPKRTEPCDKAS
jgi:branched-chain amino acid transport system substrate-binding protein